MDVSVVAIERPAEFMYPTNGGTHVDFQQPFTWTAIPTAQAYYLKIGTQPGIGDVLDSGGLTPQTTSYQLWHSVAPGQVLHACLSTKLSGVWWDANISFTIGVPAAFVYPRHMSRCVDVSIPFHWTAANAPAAYRCTVGTTKGATDIDPTGQRRILICRFCLCYVRVRHGGGDSAYLSFRSRLADLISQGDAFGSRRETARCLGRI